MARQVEYADITERLLATGKTGMALRSELTRACPSVMRQIRRDSRQPALLRLWGESVNIDELADATIVPAPILQELCAAAGVPSNGQTAHAGIAHTYGYLFSQIETPFGFKRQRWVEDRITRIAGLPLGTLGPDPRRGTLLSNLTYFLSRIAMRTRRRELAMLRSFRATVSPAVKQYPYRRVRIQRITESIPCSDVTLVTDIIRPPDRDRDESLLIYWHIDRSGSGRLITAFTISPEVMGELTADTRLGRRAEIRARFNAWIPELCGEIIGSRQLRTL